ncbi:molybdopterin molybdenumtransferase MoeA, partial [Verrucomicrobiota bacterium]
MIPFSDAYKIAMNSARRLGDERIAISEALGRVLAEDVKSDMDMPPFNKSAMDGFACRKKDLKDDLVIIETIPAGYVPERKIGQNECARIMTGSIVPEGADCVIMVEHTEMA